MNISAIQLSDVAATSLTTLYCRALESESSRPLINDPMAVELTEKLTPILYDSESRHHQQLASGRVDTQLAAYVAMRAQRFDDFVRDYLRRFPEAVIVNLGCGFDTRFFRINDDRMVLYDLDLPEVIQIKQKLLPQHPSYHFIAASVTDTDWLKQLPASQKSVLFLAEGLFMYLPASKVKSLVLGLQAQYPGCELVAEVFNTRWLNPMLKWSVDVQLQFRHLFGKEATFRSGLLKSQDMESWHDGVEFLDEWCALDEAEPKLGAAARFLRYSDFFRKALWVVHYRLNPAP